MRNLERRLAVLEGPGRNEFSHLTDEELCAKLETLEDQIESTIEDAAELARYKNWRGRWREAYDSGNSLEMGRMIREREAWLFVD